MRRAFDLKELMSENYESELIEKLKDKLVDVPELEGVIEKIAGLSVDEATKIQIQIVEQDFTKCENRTYEKIIQFR